jgi:hypothetical protein
VSTANTFTIDTTAPAVTLTSPATCSQTTANTPDFSGAAGNATGDLQTVTVNVYSGIGTSGALVETLHADTGGDNTWSVIDPPDLPGGTYTAQASQADQAGNVKTTPGNTFNVATTAVSLDAPAPCSFVTSSTPTFSGHASNGTGDSPTVTVNIYSGWTTSGTPVQTLTAIESSGTWSVAPTSPLPDGVYTAQATQTLASGTSTSPANRFTVDTVAPAVTLTTPADGSSTSNAEPQFAGAAGTASGDKSAIKVKIYAGSAASGTPTRTLNATAHAGSWSVTPGTALAPGTYTAQATQQDSAGNLGTSSPHTFTIN